MLGMKLFSARFVNNSNDFEDAVKLSRLLGITTETELRVILNKFFKHESIRERNKNNSNMIGRFMRQLVEEIKK